MIAQSLGSQMDLFGSDKAHLTGCQKTVSENLRDLTLTLVQLYRQRLNERGASGKLMAAWAKAKRLYVESRARENHDERAAWAEVHSAEAVAWKMAIEQEGGAA